jgi:hypothetical protein
VQSKANSQHAKGSRNDTLVLLDTCFGARITKSCDDGTFIKERLSATGSHDHGAALSEDDAVVALRDPALSRLPINRNAVMASESPAMSYLVTLLISSPW